MIKRLGWVSVFGLLVGSSVVGAQEPETDEAKLLGKVTDATTGSPVLGAFVGIQGKKWGVTTNDDGLFLIEGLSPGEVSISIEQLGYVDILQTVQVGRDSGTVEFLLTPDPILMEGIQVVMDRFKRRRLSYPYAHQLVEADDLARSPYPDLVELIASTSFLRPFPCPWRILENTCARVRGQTVPVTVYIDEFPTPGGLDYLRSVQPQELHLVEIFHSKSHVRAYTKAFMERTGERPRALMPLWY